MTSINTDSFKPFSLSSTMAFVTVWQAFFVGNDIIRYLLGEKNVENVQSRDGVEKVHLNLALSELSKSEKADQNHCLP